MRIHENKNKCYELAEDYFSKNQNRILNSWSIKRCLNDFYQPDFYSFFEDEDFCLPIVVKNNIATFFGGDLPYNEENILHNSSFINNCFDSLTKRGIEIKITSIQNDCLITLDERHKKLDVPYNQNWFIENFNNFDFDKHIKCLDKKTRKRINRSHQFINDEVVKEYIGSTDYLKYRDNIFDASINFFDARGKKNAWSDKKCLYDSIVQEFSKFENVNCIFFDKKDKMIGSYSVVINDAEMLLAFSNAYTQDNDYVTYALYYDMIESLQNYIKKYNLGNTFLNASRGNFNYKKRFGFKPIPMYALVNAQSWLTKYNEDLTVQQTLDLYKRDFGVFSK